LYLLLTTTAFGGASCLLTTYCMLSIITVSWNVKEHLRRCLKSIAQYAPHVPFEIIVIDNNSHDGSADMVASEFPYVKLIRNNGNLGFAKGCNQGARVAQGEFLFFLNPDTEVTAGALDTLVTFFEKNPSTGLVAPRIVEENGKLLYSIRRSPTPLIFLATLLKFQKLFPNLPFFQKYYAHDFDYTKEGSIEQPQGAAMVMRKKVFDILHGFDERFFLWLDEVDLCKRIADAGFNLKYTPHVTIMHAGGKSFRQKRILERQLLFFQSSAQYTKKHFGWKKAWYALLPMQLYIALLSKPLYTIIALGIASAELVSYIGYGNPFVRDLGFYGVAVLAFFLTLMRLEYGIMILAVELIIGSKGHLFFTSLGGHEIGIRIILFGIVFLVWLLQFCYSLYKKNNYFSNSFFTSKLFIPHSILAGLVVLGIGNGIVQGIPGDNIFKDANGWFFFLAVFPLYQGIQKKEHIQRLLSICAIALCFLVLKSLLALYILGHQGFGYETIYSFYRWIRTTGVGEAAHLGMNVYRIFFQSHFYLLPGLFIILSYLAVTKKSLKKLSFLYVLLTGVITTLLISFSRSFWIAGFVTLLCFVGVSFLVKFSARQFFKTLIIGFFASIISLGLIFGITRFPIPETEGGFDLSLLKNRFASDEAALVSRWQALPVLVNVFIKNPLVGYGFGKEVTYFSRDPRVLEKNATGEFTTYSFEWGYLDILIKLGVLGLLAVCMLLVYVIRIGLKAYTACKDSQDSYLVLGLLLGLCALIITHIFTPYLNHPLGIGYLIFCSVVFERFMKIFSNSRG